MLEFNTRIPELVKRKIQMARYRLSGLRRVDAIYWHDVRNVPGVYLFYMTKGGPVRYVGRSDRNLYGRINGRSYRYYKYKHTGSDIEAYDWECKYLHDHWDTIDNINHPATPRGLKNRIACEFCDWQQ